ncbi:PIN domain-containing protein [Butyrivibrio fibrisolvens]|uniref:PIN domain-containing protein n=1 Tax=Butyrivibrio fibrisolvens TaxID=831 RepID=UPI00040BE60F|nr:PIN domain-containing protein [Butyrivibrio fibrisolvens]
MRASLDTNAIIHFYKAGLQNILFEFFDDGVFIYEQIRNIELNNHGRDILEAVDSDIRAGKIVLYTDEQLKKQAVFKIFQTNVNENRHLYGKGDLGEVYAISLAQTIGAYALVTDDIKQGGPYMSLLQFEDEVMPFTFADILILRFILGDVDAKQTVSDFNLINDKSELNWAFRSQVTKFIKRFLTDPYREDDKEWIRSRASACGVSIKNKMVELSRLL